MNKYVWKITDMKANGEGGVTGISWECVATTPEGESYTATGSKDYTTFGARLENCDCFSRPRGHSSR